MRPTPPWVRQTVRSVRQDVRWALADATNGPPTVWLRPVTGAVIGLGAVAAAWLLDGYTLSSLTRIMSLGLLALSVALLAGHAGLASLGQVAPYAVGGYTAALLAKADHTIGLVQLGAAAAMAAVFSLLVGVAVTRTRGVVFLMVTLAVGVLTATAAQQWRGVTGGTDGLGGIPATRPWWGLAPLATDRAVYLYALAVTASVLVGVWWLLRSPAGLLLRGCRDHETRMRACGHRVGGYLLAAHVGAGAVAGIGGALLVTGQRYISPHDVGFEISALVLLAVVIGGAGSLGGAIAATGVVVAVRDWAGAFTPGHTPLLLGVLFIAAVYTPHAWSWLAHRIRPPATQRDEEEGAR